MRVRPLVVVVLALALAVAGCGGGSDVEPTAVVWERGGDGPRLPVPADAAWEPRYQDLRQKLRASGGETGGGVTCFSVRTMDEAIAFYAPLYGLDPAALEPEQLPLESQLEAFRAVSAELGEEIPVAIRVGTTNRVVLPARRDLPLLVLESPYPNARTGRLLDRVLITMSWEEAP